MVENGFCLEDDFSNLCRLCLKTDEAKVNIFDRLDVNSKRPIRERIYDLYQVKIDKNDGLPTNICDKCLYYTETFIDFRSHVRKCEAKLQNHLAAVGMHGNDKLSELYRKIDESIESGNNFQDDSNNVTVVDPNQAYESSDEDFFMDSENEDEYSMQAELTTTNDIENKTESNSQRPIYSEAENNGNNSSQSLSVKKNETNLSMESQIETTKILYYCEYCEMAFITKAQCSEHEATHDPENPFICNFCTFKASNRPMLIYHIKKIHNIDRPFVCKTCNKGFIRRSDLKKHVIVHTGVRPYSCRLCVKTFSRNTNLTKHMRIHNAVKPHACNSCPLTFSTPSELQRHKRTHSSNKQFNCSKCDVSFERQDQLYSHQIFHLKEDAHMLEIQQQQSQQKPATDSGVFDSESIVIPINPFSDINQHENQSFPNERLTEILNSNQGTQENYLFHSGTQATNDQISKPPSLAEPRTKTARLNTCNICSKTFSRKKELQIHYFTHTAEKPYQCPTCNKMFNRRDKLIRHERIHTEDKYFCNQCQLGFSKQEALDMHIKVHELERQQSGGPSSFGQHLAAGNNDMLGYYDNYLPQRQMGLGFYSEIRSDD